MIQRKPAVIGCPSCGYNLIGSPPRGRCPECGKRYRDLKPGGALAFWTNRRFAMLLVLTPVGACVAQLFLFVVAVLVPAFSRPGGFSAADDSVILLGMFVVFVWQIPLILLSGAAALMSRFRGATIIAVGMGALTHLVIGLWGGWVILTSHDAQASIGIFFVPVYLGMGSWSVAILSFVAASLLISVRGSRLGAG